jgi:hypothetical protein
LARRGLRRLLSALAAHRSRLGEQLLDEVPVVLDLLLVLRSRRRSAEAGIHLADPAIAAEKNRGGVGGNALELRQAGRRLLDDAGAGVEQRPRMPNLSRKRRICGCRASLSPVTS